jgi:mono/diheme cytochrome c family protein
MPPYRFQIEEQDRWAIVAYVRVLQRAARGTLDDVPPELRGELR